MKDIILATLSNQDVIRRYGKAIIIDFKGARQILSTSMLNGGIQENMTHVFNYNCLADVYDCSLTEDSYENELKKNAASLLLDPVHCSGLSTAAYIENAHIQTEVYKDLEVTAVVTAGIDHNAVRVGDPASYVESYNEFHPLPKGTINILLHINKQLTKGCLVRAFMVCSEAKSAAIAELQLGSNYSTGIATGSGTDGAILIGDLECENILTDAGGHSKLGELIGVCVMKAVKQALLKQTAASPARQHAILERGKRYGITLGSLWKTYQTYYKNIENEEDQNIKSEPMTTKHQHLYYPPSILEFEQKILSMNNNSNAVVFTSLYLHLIDQFQWNLLEWAEVYRESKSLCQWFLQVHSIDQERYDFLSYETDHKIEQLITLYQYAYLIVSLNCLL